MTFQISSIPGNCGRRRRSIFWMFKILILNINQSNGAYNQESSKISTIERRLFSLRSSERFQLGLCEECGSRPVWEVPRRYINKNVFFYVWLVKDIVLCVPLSWNWLENVSYLIWCLPSFQYVLVTSGDLGLSPWHTLNICYVCLLTSPTIAYLHSTCIHHFRKMLFYSQKKRNSVPPVMLEWMPFFLGPDTTIRWLNSSVFIEHNCS